MTERAKIFYCWLAETELRLEREKDEGMEMSWVSRVEIRVKCTCCLQIFFKAGGRTECMVLLYIGLWLCIVAPAEHGFL